MNKKTISIVALFSCALLVEAREFWLEPIKYFLNPGENLIVNFQEGENFMGDAWNFKKSQIEKLELYQEKGVTDLKDQVTEASKNQLQVALQAEGTYLLAVKGNNTIRELDAEKFNNYLKDAGLDEVLDQREKTNSLAKSGKESYVNNAKLLVQVGKKTDDTFKKPLGHRAEIIPQQNPYSLKIGDPIKFKILFEGKPVFTAKVKVWNRYNNRTTAQNIYSQQDGMIETHVSNPGAWMVSFVKIVPSKNPGADWQSYSATLVFGVR